MMVQLPAGTFQRRCPFRSTDAVRSTMLRLSATAMGGGPAEAQIPRAPLFLPSLMLLADHSFSDPASELNRSRRGPSLTRLALCDASTLVPSGLYSSNSASSTRSFRG